jgi:AraC-like DNA-binding protein
MSGLVARLFHRKNSLFAQLLISFLVVIVLLAAFNFASFLFLKNKISQEIIRYNSLNMQKTTEGFEKQLQILQNTMLNLYRKESVILDLNELRQLPEGTGYDRMKELQKELIAIQTNPSLHLDNVIAYFGRGQFVVEKDGSSATKDMFGKYYASDSYSPDFWEGRLMQSDFFHLYPATGFYETSMATKRAIGNLLPIVVRSQIYNDMYFIAMLDVEALFEQLHVSPDSMFTMIGKDGQPLFSSQSLPEAVDLSALDPDKDYVTYHQSYYFYKRGADTGFTYLTVVPTQSISSQLFRLNMILISLLALTIVIGVAASVLFSIRLNNPVRKIIDSIQQYRGDDVPTRSRIQEFQVIGEAMRHLVDKNASMNQDIDHKNSLLQYYSFINRLKRIHNGTEAASDEALFGNRPFSLLLLEVQVLPDAPGLSEHEPERVTYFIREFVGSFVSRKVEDAVTLQLDSEQILVLLFGEDGIEGASLNELTTILNHDKASVACTLAVTPVYRQPSDFNAAYELALATVRQRPLGEGALTVRRLVPDAAAFQLSAQQEEELRLRIQSGNADAMREWAERLLRTMGETAGRFLPDYRAFAERVVQLSQSELGSTPVPGVGEVVTRINACWTEAQFTAFFADWFEQVAGIVNVRAEEADPVSQFVLRFVEEHLAEDISLDMVADKLNISRGYLSTYFKEKTGVNFSDYLNQLRIQKTKEMLGDLNLKINDISSRLGYQNVNSFIRMFKRYSGMTPGEYRKKLMSGL